MNGFLIAGTASGVGKTTVTLAILAAMRRRGLIVQPFKGGPDFLDTGHHTKIAGRVARNLDTWMLTTEANGEVLREASDGADLSIVEGMMGLFDGKDGATERGSSAEIAKLFQLPVVLVLDAAKSARSIAAVVLGFEQFDPELRLAGVILNRAASDRHFQMLEIAINNSCQTPVLGWLPRDAGIAIPERHLGLKTVEEFDDAESLELRITSLALLAEKHLRLDVLASLIFRFNFEKRSCPSEQAEQRSVRIGVARDRAFSFYYEDNLDLLRQQGAEIVPFSPLTDAVLPGSLDALYLGGGYPELYASELSSNQSMLDSIRSFAASERPIYAECGGMIYLSHQLISIDGQSHTMAGVLPLSIEMTEKLVKFGYVTVEMKRDCLLGRCGTILRGHCFHYSRIIGVPGLPTSYRVSYSLSAQQEDEGFHVGSVLASYVHLHFRAQPDIAHHFVHNARLVKEKESINA
jgi:cobyrinic acid a,c-diamide synthase